MHVIGHDMQKVRGSQGLTALHVAPGLCQALLVAMQVQWAECAGGHSWAACKVLEELHLCLPLLEGRMTERRQNTKKMPEAFGSCTDSQASCCDVQEIIGLQGLIVVDVVEGTALASLPHMQTILASRPRSFPSPDAAINWALHSGAAIFC